MAADANVMASIAAAAAGSIGAVDASVVDACTEELGGTDLNTVIIAACVLEFIALTGAGVGGECGEEGSKVTVMESNKATEIRQGKRGK